MGRRGRWEYFRAVHARYRRSDRQSKAKILDEFCANTHYNRKYALRLLNGPPPGSRPSQAVRARRASYPAAVISLVKAIWKAAGYPWSVRLKALIPLWMPWVRKRYGLSAAMERQLLAISPRQIDRRLQAAKLSQQRRVYGGTRPGRLLKHQVPLRVDRWDARVPGFTEVDLVAHSGDSGEGEFAYSLNVTDVYSGWTESRAVLGRGQAGVAAALEEIAEVLPFRLLGIDSDNGSEFLNWHVARWCTRREIQFTRGRPYKKDDNAHIEQKNWTHVRKLVGWERYDTVKAVESMNDLYRNELRLWLNIFQPSVKLLRKVRVGSRVRRVYEAARTPLDRVQASEVGHAEALARLQTQQKSWDPFELSRRIEEKLGVLYEMAHAKLSPSRNSSSRRPTRRH
ncbi:MAG: DDE-type integrase/transposase/recombinase [Terriglobales bacterium]